MAGACVTMTHVVCDNDGWCVTDEGRPVGALLGTLY